MNFKSTIFFVLGSLSLMGIGIGCGGGKAELPISVLPPSGGGGYAMTSLRGAFAYYGTACLDWEALGKEPTRQVFTEVFPPPGKEKQVLQTPEALIPFLYQESDSVSAEEKTKVAQLLGQFSQAVLEFGVMPDQPSEFQVRLFRNSNGVNSDSESDAGDGDEAPVVPIAQISLKAQEGSRNFPPYQVLFKPNVHLDESLKFEVQNHVSEGNQRPWVVLPLVDLSQEGLASASLANHGVCLGSQKRVVLFQPVKAVSPFGQVQNQVDQERFAGVFQRIQAYEESAFKTLKTSHKARLQKIKEFKDAGWTEERESFWRQFLEDQEGFKAAEKDDLLIQIAESEGGAGKKQPKLIQHTEDPDAGWSLKGLKKLYDARVVELKEVHQDEETAHEGDEGEGEGDEGDDAQVKEIVPFPNAQQVRDDLTKNDDDEGQHKQAARVAFVDSLKEVLEFLQFPVLLQGRHQEALYQSSLTSGAAEALGGEGYNEEKEPEDEAGAAGVDFSAIEKSLQDAWGQLNHNLRPLLGERSEEEVHFFDNPGRWFCMGKDFPAIPGGDSGSCCVE